MKITAYAKAKNILLSKFVLSEVNLSSYHYNKLIKEASTRLTGLERRLQIKDELRVIRMLRREQAVKPVKPVKNTGFIEENYIFNDNQYAFVCD